MPDPAWPSLPPEANYLRLVGPGAAGTATTMANAVAWEVLAASHEAAFSLSTLNAAVTAVDFEGIGGVSSAATVGGLNTSLQLLAGWVAAASRGAATAGMGTGAIPNVARRHRNCCPREGCGRPRRWTSCAGRGGTAAAIVPAELSDFRTGPGSWH